MKNRELAWLALNTIRHRRLRSWLAILGIVIGVGAIISLMSISTGMNAQIQSQLGGLGANIITISPGGGQAQRMGAPGGDMPGGSSGGSTEAATITFKEADSLRRIAGVGELDARVQGRGSVSYRNKNTSVTVIGIEPAAFPASSGTTISEGRTLGAGDMSSVVIGASVTSEMFGEDMLNKQIKINGVPFRVVGVLNASGASFSGPDRSIFISQRAAKNLFNQTQDVSSVVVIAADGSNPDVVAAAITEKLLELHRKQASAQDFSVTTASSMQSTISSITNTLGLFLGGIASIALLVGGIGVANAMFTSVLEQTRYIGILKALGTTNMDVMKIFLFESGMVGLVGGLLGIALSFIASMALSSFGMPTKITFELMLLGLGFSIIVGTVSGLIPARNASSVEPVEALRYE
ncbi:MacB-like periplasmic core domain protein [Candidatus Burarchaeum australiense]|nr:MacB-like periplasmic core domain protein [Candidatus Burarchaeum australiense]